MDKDKMINIAEKVKFWEEQDRINKAIIPRVLKNHDLIAELSEKLTEYTDTIISLEVKIKNLQRKIECSEKEKLKSKFNVSNILSIAAIIISIVSILV